MLNSQNNFTRLPSKVLTPLVVSYWFFWRFFYDNPCELAPLVSPTNIKEHVRILIGLAMTRIKRKRKNKEDLRNCQKWRVQWRGKKALGILFTMNLNESFSGVKVEWVRSSGVCRIHENDLIGGVYKSFLSKHQDQKLQLTFTPKSHSKPISRATLGYYFNWVSGVTLVWKWCLRFMA